MASLHNFVSTLFLLWPRSWRVRKGVWPQRGVSLFGAWHGINDIGVTNGKNVLKWDVFGAKGGISTSNTSLNELNHCHQVSSAGTVKFHILWNKVRFTELIKKFYVSRTVLHCQFVSSITSLWIHNSCQKAKSDFHSGWNGTVPAKDRGQQRLLKEGTWTEPALLLSGLFTRHPCSQQKRGNVFLL